jgi:hypothetical protein
MEGQIWTEGQRRRPVGLHERRVDGLQTPVQDTNQKLERSARHAESILHAEESCGEREVREQARCEGKGGEGEANDGQVLHVPAIRIIDRVGIPDQVGEGVPERSEAGSLTTRHNLSIPLRWFLWERKWDGRTCRAAEAPREGDSSRCSG